MSFFISFLGGTVLARAFLFFPYLTSAVFLVSAFSLVVRKRFLLLVVLSLATVLSYARCAISPVSPDVKEEIQVSGTFQSYAGKTGSGLFKHAFLIETVSNAVAQPLRGREITLLSERAFEPGCESSLIVRILPSGRKMNPGQEGEERIYAKLIHVTASERNTSVRGTIERWRSEIEKHVSRNFGKDEAGLVAAITIGSTNLLGEDMKNAFGATGLAHILSISGTHFGLFSFLLFAVFRFSIGMLPYRFLQFMTMYVSPAQASAVLCVPFMFAYLGLSGASIPAVRSFIMITLFLAGLLVCRKGYWLNSLLLAAFLIVLWDPGSLFSISFQLSFVAVLCIGFVADGTERCKGAGEKVRRYAKNALKITAAVTAGTAPLVAYHFHYLSLISPLANTLVAPLAGFLLIPPAVVSCFFFIFTGNFVFASIVAPVAEMTITVVKFLSSVPRASLPVPAFPPAVLLLFYGGCVLSFFLKKRWDRARGESSHVSDSGDWEFQRESGKSIGKFRLRSCRKVLIVVIPLLPFLIYFCVSMHAREPLAVTFLDVGQGDSAVVEFPGNKTMVIDTGKTGRETAAFLDYRGKKVIDVLALSHSHPDHTGGLELLRERFFVREIWDNGWNVREPEISIRRIERGDVTSIEGCAILAFHPYPGFYTARGDGYRSENNDSLVLKVEGVNISYLFAGDVEEEAEEDMGHLGKWLKSTVIKIPHHGARSSLCEFFLREVGPVIAVISAGRNNSFGHPHPEVLSALHQLRVLRTDNDGAVKISDGPGGPEIKTFRDFSFEKTSVVTGEIANLKKLFQVW